MSADHGDQGDEGHGEPFGPPTEPCECWCMHCERVFMSTGIWYQRVVGAPEGEKDLGRWMCPTPNCDGAGFTFDIFPTDPNHPANEGWTSFDDDEADLEYDEDGNPILDESGNPVESEWDPDEAKWKELDEEMAGYEDEDDLEGEEWKHGLAPGERPPEPPWVEEARREQEEQERQYDEPDRRPREVPWEPRHGSGKKSGDDITEDDIPF